jgi:phage-related protein
MAAKTLRVNIVGDSSSAEKSLTNVSKSVGTSSSTMGRVGSTLAGVGSAVTGVATKVASFATSGANDFADWAGQVVSVQKVMGGTTEEASRLSYQAKILGVDSGALAKGMQFLAKDVAGGGKGLAALGISTKDASGHVKSMPELLKEVSAKLQGIPPGAQRTAAILKIFGKSGMALTPILNANAQTMNDLGKESDALGYTLDSKATASVKNHAVEQRRLQAAFGAVKMQIGQALMPVLTDLGKMFAERIVPIIKDVVKWTKDHEGVVKVLIGVLAGFVVVLKAINAATSAYRVIMVGVRVAVLAYRGVLILMRGLTVAWTAAQWLLNVAMTANPIGLIIVAIVALIAIFVALWMKCAWFRDFWKAVWNGIKAVAVAIWNFLKDHFKLIITIMLSVMTGGLFFLITHWKQVWGAIKAVFVAIWDFIKAHFKTVMTVVLSIMTGGLFYIFTHWSQVWNGVKAVFGAVWNWIKSTLGAVLNWIKGVWTTEWNAIKGFFVGIWDGIKGAFGAAVNWVRDKVGFFIDVVKSIPDKIKGIFTGLWDGLKQGFKDVINWIIDGINVMIRAYTDSAGQLPGTPDIHEIDRLAKGGTITHAGMALVGEKGPELLNLPGGASVIPLPRAAAGGGDVYVTVNVAGSVKTEQELVTAIRDGIVRLGKRNGGLARL